MSLLDLINPVSTFVKPYKWIIIAIVVALVLGYIGVLKYKNISLEKDIVICKAEIDSLKKDNEKLDNTNSENEKQYTKTVDELNIIIGKNKKICSETIEFVRKQLKICYETRCIDVSPGNTNSYSDSNNNNKVQVLDNDSSYKHLVLYNEIITNFNNRNLQ